MEIPLVSRVAALGTGDYSPVKSFKEAKSVFWTETMNLWKIAGPVALTAFFQFLQTRSSTSIYAGHLGDLELSSISVHNSVMFSIYFGLLFGMSAALQTVCGQAYGAGQIQSLGIYLQRSWIVLLITCIFLLPLYIFATPFLKLLGQEEDIAELAGKYAQQSIPQMFAFAISLPTQRFLQSQSKVKVITCITFVALLVQNLLLYIFIYVFSWGTTGASMAGNVSGWLIAVAQVSYVVKWSKEGWNGFSWLAFRDLGSFSRLATASSAMYCLEQWYSSCIAVLAGQLDNAVIAVGSFSICMDFYGWQYMLLLGINAAISVRVSNTLGMCHPRAAKYIFFVTMFQSVLLGVVFMIVIFLIRNNLAIIFTNSKDMQLAVADLAYLLGLSMLLNSVAQVISGVAIGIGWQVMLSYINLACYYIVGLPLGIMLCFKANFGVKGIWGGTMCGCILQILIPVLVIWKTNWTKEVEKTAKRIQILGSRHT